MSTKLYVGNLAYETTEEELRTLFAQAGVISAVALIRDHDTGQSKGFAFVEMATAAEAQKAIGLFHAYVLGERELRVNISQPRPPDAGRQDPLKVRASGGHAPKIKATQPHQEQGGYQSKLSAFEKSGTASSPRRRGGSQHY